MIGAQESLNKVQLIGRVVAAPEVHQTIARTNVATWEMETTKRWEDGDGQSRSRTERHQISFFGAKAPAIAALIAASPWVLVEGELQYRSSGDAFVSASFCAPWKVA